MLVRIGNGQVVDFGDYWEEYRSHHPEHNNIDEDGAPLHPRFAVKELDYHKNQVFDAFARILEVVKPCCAVLPTLTKINKTEVLTSLLISYNEQVTIDTNIKVRTAIEDTLSKLISIRKQSADIKYGLTLQLLSNIMYLQEYKAVSNYGKLCSILGNDIRANKFAGIFDESLKYMLPFINMFLRHSEDIFRYYLSFNDPRFAEYQIDLGYKTKLKTALDSLLEKHEFESPKLLVEKYGNSDEVSISYIKLSYILKYVFEKIPEAYKEKKASLLQDLDAYNTSFSRAMIDIASISDYLNQFPDLQSIEFDFADNGIRKSGDEIHCELAILQDLIAKAIAKSGGGPINPLDILTQYLGVSKLSCVQCFAVFDFVGLGQFVRGGHGVWFNSKWNIPKWDFSATEKTLLEHIREYIDNPQQLLNEMTEGDQAFFLMLGKQYKSYNMHNDALSVHGEDKHYIRHNSTDVMPEDFLYQCFRAMQNTIEVAAKETDDSVDQVDEENVATLAQSTGEPTAVPPPQDSGRQSFDICTPARRENSSSASSGYGSPTIHQSHITNEYSQKYHDADMDSITQQSDLAENQETRPITPIEAHAELVENSRPDSSMNGPSNIASDMQTTLDSGGNTNNHDCSCLGISCQGCIIL